MDAGMDPLSKATTETMAIIRKDLLEAARNLNSAASHLDAIEQIDVPTTTYITGLKFHTTDMLKHSKSLRDGLRAVRKESDRREAAG